MEKVSKEHKKLIEDRASLVKAMAHPVRLCVLDKLINEGEKNVTEIVDCMDVTQSNLSQHLSKLRDLGIVEARKEGNLIYYSIEREDVISIVNVIMRGA
ncbi:metalloregulator ArsR/SmtB family transcription factor [Peptoniphilus sp. MSJ-1]|uniref:Metalloregulator ArsR/SmtB family transcription factor n=1 Tax=Peptoniphilus ovalis TaxID=2841503 RepID=A0ABS6FFX5_9FIRM|nr:metalloregulator ArsR/SmtB family transcription factor [Peptoniphilus ovalis]MBU5668368.1 metalloregulator ArsR/SmtB family transcription factor [Peptoniphilus ovalis]